MLIIIVISACFAYFGMVIGMYLILKKFDADNDIYTRRMMSGFWPLWIGLIPIIAIGRAVKIIFDKIDEDINEEK